MLVQSAVMMHSIFGCLFSARGRSALKVSGPVSVLIARRSMIVQSVDMKYIDPSYQIRAVPTNCNDRIYCKVSNLHGSSHCPL